ncbi:MAG: GatB/YqeY domain-containing protein, partial [Oscillospiraceae bacterium]
IDKRADLTAEEELEVVSREVKQLKETIELSPADRTAIIDECRQRIEVLSAFLPKQMDEAEIRATIESVLSKLGLTAPTAKEKGMIMKELMPQTKGKADGKEVNQILATYLN